MGAEAFRGKIYRERGAKVNLFFFLKGGPKFLGEGSQIGPKGREKNRPERKHPPGGVLAERSGPKKKTGVVERRKEKVARTREIRRLKNPRRIPRLSSHWLLLFCLLGS